jgi:hypothetical protein
VREANYHADIFAFGVALYETLNGKRAFSGASVVDVLSAILKDGPRELSGTIAKLSLARKDCAALFGYARALACWRASLAATK